MSPPDPELIGFGHDAHAAGASDRVRELLAAARMAILPPPDEAPEDRQHSIVALAKEPLQHIADDLAKIAHVLQDGIEADRMVAAAALDQVRERLSEFIRNCPEQKKIADDAFRGRAEQRIKRQAR